ncbi:M90 family metallopeptidase [Marinobacterium arenosum]|uniref:M90 family metallopeptidase n=1 Tax=Marinobacterium arenosum TaxID=2862496 RepID=UPI001C93FD8D|nr:M90 family metallopeptidase [Marinobacterium arenosum]MBY4678969.1 zinc-dependent peptidase [Marinobacterium arenosum]
MFDKLLARLNSFTHSHTAIDEHIWQQTVAAVPLLQSQDAQALAELRAMSGRFLAEKHFFGGDGLEPTPAMAVRVAALACLPVLHLGYHWLDGIRELVIYPEKFLVHREEQDEYGVVHERYEPLSGEAWEHGTLVLAWPDVVDSGLMSDGYNVVIHEVAHVLDVRNGAFNGFPPLPLQMDAGQWTVDFSAAFDALNRQLDADIEPLIDPYAATAPTEFFAVTSEYHFERPDNLHQAFPAVAAQLALFYGRP